MAVALKKLGFQVVVKRLEEQRAELLAHNEEMRKALDDARIARQAAKAAEEKRCAALKAAERKAAQDTTAKKSNADKAKADP